MGNQFWVYTIDWLTAYSDWKLTGESYSTDHREDFVSALWVLMKKKQEIITGENQHHLVFTDM